MLSTEKLAKLVGQLAIVAIGAFIALKVNETMGKAKIALPKKDA